MYIVQTIRTKPLFIPEDYREITSIFASTYIALDTPWLHANVYAVRLFLLLSGKPLQIF